MSRKNNLIIPTGATIGSIDAENDRKFLDEAFVDHPAMRSLIDLESSKMVLVGRTGSGKSAILLEITKSFQDSSHRIEATDVAMDHLYNTTIVTWLTQNGFNTNKFLDVIWHHVFIKTRVRARYGNQSLLQRTFETSSEKKLLLEYVKNYASGVFEQHEIDEGQIARSVVGELSASVKSFGGFETSAGAEINTEERLAIQKRLTEAVPSALLRHQARCRKILQTQKDDQKKPLYIVIDDLDAELGNLELQKQLISSLFRVCSHYSGFSDLQFCVAIREDIYRLVSKDVVPGNNFFEKFKDKVIFLQWEDELLAEMIQKRINYLFEYQYTQDKIGFDDIFKSAVLGEFSPMEYILDRTMRRPRGVIQFVNYCLELAEKKSDVTSSNITSAEKAYSSERLQWLMEEWVLLKPHCRFMIEGLRGFDAVFRFKKLKSLMNDNGWAVELLEIFENTKDHEACKLVEKAYDSGVDSQAFNQFAIMCVRDFVLMGVFEISEAGAWRSAVHTHLDLSTLNNNDKIPRYLIGLCNWTPRRARWNLSPHAAKPHRQNTLHRTPAAGLVTQNGPGRPWLWLGGLG